MCTSPVPAISTFILPYLPFSMIMLCWAPQCCFHQSLVHLWVMCGSTQIAPSLSHASSIRGKMGGGGGKMGTNWNCHYCNWMSRHSPLQSLESIDFYLIYCYLRPCLACLMEMDAQASADLLMWVKLSTSELAGFGPKLIAAKHLATCPEFI